MKKSKLLILTALLITILCACSFDIYIDDGENERTSDIAVHFLDVGQGDSEFIELPNSECMLIDAGVSGEGEFISNYIKDCGYKKIDYLVATHPHADHIGSMKYIVDNMDIGQIYMPNVSANTKTFEKLLDSIKKKELKVKSAKSGMNIFNDGDLSVDILGPVEIDEEHLNNCSVIIKLTYKADSYLFIGDAEKEELNTVTADMSADILKTGHHGSSTSTTKNFLQEVNPSYAVISCGKDNDYGHPHKETLKLFKDFDVEYYRTDKQGTITVNSNGLQDYKITTEK